ncbi:polyketide synthase [Paenibacillus psychroresistens]|uniref:Polyketide synthase n=1 Tax=Paenibacillus psychroresistens TaxID=1778678 RepID=A0A6B8RKK2_9BACL|nr:type I polyketide synthase [Paenibacillus psychroresistens]QGQ96122.1 polyketide synthase [Paenibacillus psychroresistens]
MEKIAKIIFENIVSGQIERNLGAKLLETLKNESVSLNENEVRSNSYENMAIVGMSAKLPKANSLDEFWDNLRHGVDCISDFPETRQMDVERLIQYTYMKDKEITYSAGGYLDEIDKFDYKFFNISPKEASLMDPVQRLFLQTAWNTLEDAGYGGEKLTGSRTGLYVGYSGWPMYGQFVSHVEPASFEISVMGNISAIISKRLPQLLNFRGPSMLIDTACSSSLVALHLATQSIRTGECDQALVGGIRILLMPVDRIISYGIESQKQSKAKAFDESADGTVLSEGIAAILIKPLSKAIKEGDHIYAVIKGSAINQDGKSIGITTPNVAAQEDVILRAWKDAEIDPQTISYIEAMGTATKIGDPIEIDAIQKAFRRYTDKKQFCAIGSLKTSIGHTDSAAGIVAIIKAALALKHKEIPPMVHFERPNRNINFDQSPVYINDKLQKWVSEDSPRRCGVSSFGFSGTNCHVVLEEAPEAAFVQERAAVEPQIFTLSAKSEGSLLRLIERYTEFITNNIDLDLADVCYTANTGRGHYQHRLAIIFEDRNDFMQKLDLAARVPFQQINEPGMGILDEMCKLYTKGAEVDWEKLYEGKKRMKVRLPLYCFENQRCWIQNSDLNNSKVTKPKDILKEITFNF